MKNMFHIDKAMNMIKEEILRDLSESVTYQRLHRKNKLNPKSNLSSSC